MPEIKSFGGMKNHSAAGHQGMINQFNEGQRVDYLDDVIWDHRCSSIIPMISDPSWFNQVDENCVDTVMYKLEPQGIKMSAMNAYNQRLKSHTPHQNTIQMSFGEWAYSQWKFSKMEIDEKCDWDAFKRDLEIKFKIVLDEYVERIALMRMACINPCWNTACAKINTGTATSPLKITIHNSHLLPIMGDTIKKNQCDDRGHFMIWPKCESLVLSQNEEIKQFYQGCCGVNVPSITGTSPKFGSNTTIIYSSQVPYRTLPNGMKVYPIIHAPYGSFGYASLLAVSEVIESDSIEDHWSTIMRMILRYGMVIPMQSDYTVFWAAFEQPQIDLLYAE